LTWRQSQEKFTYFLFFFQLFFQIFQEISKIIALNVLGMRRFGQVIGQCIALTPAQNVGGGRRGNGAKRNDLADRNPEPPPGGEAYTVCYVKWGRAFFISYHILFIYL
jgi:hypothetical protein